MFLMDHIPTFGSRLRWKKLIGYFRDVSPKHVTLTSLEYCLSIVHLRDVFPKHVTLTSLEYCPFSPNKPEIASVKNRKYFEKGETQSHAFFVENIGIFNKRKRYESPFLLFCWTKRLWAFRDGVRFGKNPNYKDSMQFIAQARPFGRE